MRRVALACVAIVACSSAARATAPFTVAQVYHEALGGLGLDFTVGGWTFSGNGHDLYVSGGDIFNTAGLMAHLSLDQTSGALTFVEAVRDEFGPPVPFGGLGGATALGPGETELYYTSIGTTAVFARDPIGGGLAFVQSVATSPVITVYDAVRVTPDGHQVLVTAGDGIIGYPRTPAGILEQPTAYPFVVRDPGDLVDVPRPGVFVVRGDGRFVYALQRDAVAGSRNAIVILARGESGDLSVVERITDGFDDWVSLGAFAPEALALSDDGRHLYAADWSPGGGMVVLMLDPVDGRARHARVFGRAADAPESTRLALSPDGGLLYTNGGGFEVWARDAATGAIERVQRIVDGEDGAGLSGVERIVSSPDGRFVFTLATQTHAITVFRRRCGDGVVETGGDAEQCDDGNFVGGDGCDAACRVEPCFTCSGEPSACAPVTGPCDDGNACTADDACTAGHCAGTPVANGASCDDGNACTTTDSCQAGACIGASRMTCGGCAVCDREVAACVGMVERGCTRPAERPTGGRDPNYVRPAVGRFAPKKRRSLHVHFSRDDAASTAGLGDPTKDTGFSLCLLDLNGGDAVFPQERQRRRVVVEARVPAASACERATCWRRERKVEFAYSSRNGLPDGVRKLVLGRTRKGGLDLTAVAGGRAFDVHGLEPAIGPVTLQVFSDTGACWEGDLNGPSRR